MKRIGYLFDSVCAPDNLRLAFWKASRGKRHREDQRAFAARLERNLAELRLGLIDGSYPVGNYRHFTVYEPKKREIYAAAFPERVLHHALMNVCGPWIERWLIHDSYACRLGKGQWRALDRARHFASKFRGKKVCPSIYSAKSKMNLTADIGQPTTADNWHRLQTRALSHHKSHASHLSHMSHLPSRMPANTAPLYCAGDMTSRGLLVIRD